MIFLSLSLSLVLNQKKKTKTDTQKQQTNGVYVCREVNKNGGQFTLFYTIHQEPCLLAFVTHYIHVNNDR